MKRKMALDVGDARIGIAFSDLLGIIANGYETYKVTKNVGNDMKHIASLITEKEVDTVVIGLPLNMDGTSGERVDIVRAFGERLKKYTSAEIVYQDERLSTVFAENSLIEGGMRRDKRKQVIDKVAATFILRSYLDKINNKGEHKMQEEKNKEVEILDNEDDYIIVFNDEDGNEVEYAIWAELDVDDKMYAVVQPVKLPEDMEEDEFEVCEIILNDAGEEEYEFVDDDDIADKVIEEYNKMLAEEDE